MKQNNPWTDISLSDYENHMSDSSVMQLQTLNLMMKKQLGSYPVESTVILGIAGGNGLEHIDRCKYKSVFCVDVNSAFIESAKEKFRCIADISEFLCLDLTEDHSRLPHAELVVADLIIEYIGYECFANVVRKINPDYVSCCIQINTDSSFVSDTPFVHCFDGLEKIHHHLENDSLIKILSDTGFVCILSEEYPLPNGKKLLRTDFRKAEP